MTITKKLRYYGNSLVVLFDKLDKELYNLETGDIIQFEIVKTIKKSKSKKK